MARPMKYPLELKQHALLLRSKGKTLKEVANIIDVKLDTVRNWYYPEVRLKAVKKWQANNRDKFLSKMSAYSKEYYKSKVVK